MKKILTVFVALAMFSVVADAQRGHHSGYRPGYRPGAYAFTDGLGVSFGYVHSTYKLSDWATEEVERTGLDGFEVALTKDFTIIDHALYLQTGLRYTYLNESENSKELGFRMIYDWDEHYLSIPVKIKYEYPILPDLCVFVSAGPTFSEGLASTMKFRGNVGGENAAISYNVYNGKVRSNTGTLDEFVSDTFPDNKYRRFDVQLGFSAGVKFLEMFEAEIGYDWGLVNKFRGANDDDIKLHRSQLYIGIALRF